LLAGQYRLGLRPVVALAAYLGGLDISTGMVSKLRTRTADALLWPWKQLARYIRTQDVNIDETPWREKKKRAYLWAAVTPLAAVFRIATGRTAEIAQQLLGKQYAGVATCDRLKSYWWIKRLQWCWAHLRRDFQAMVDRGEPGTAIGESLLAQSTTVFHRWHPLREGKLSRAGFQKAIQPVREAVRLALQRGTKSPCSKTAGTCKELLPPAVAVDLRGRRRGATDEQRGRANGTARGAVAEDERWHGQPTRQSVRGTCAACGSHLPAARQEGIGLPQRVH